MLEVARAEVTAVAATLEVRSHVSITETLELNETDRTYVVTMITERPLTEPEELAIPICPHGVPVLHRAVTPFDMWAPYSVGGKKPLAGVCNQVPSVS